MWLSRDALTVALVMPVSRQLRLRTGIACAAIVLLPLLASAAACSDPKGQTGSERGEVPPPVNKAR